MSFRNDKTRGFPLNVTFQNGWSILLFLLSNVVMRVHFPVLLFCKYRQR
jgi:hypothetical protein